MTGHAAVLLRSAAGGAAHLLLVGGLLLGLGHPLVGLLDAAGLALLGALPAGLHASRRLRLPGAVLVTSLAVAVAVELALPGPTVAVLGGERVTTGMTLLAGYTAAWPLLLALVLLTGVVGWSATATVRPRRLIATGVAGMSGLTCTGLVLLSGVTRGWVPSPVVPPAWGASGLFVLAAMAVLFLLRTRVRSPLLVLAVPLAAAAVLSWVTDPVDGNPASGLVASGVLYAVLALLLAAAELAVRAAVPAWRTVRTRACGADADRAASPSRS
ncbi:hypothetical protein [Pseudonocardia alaniniphila]|uniref:Uncharacterized protein n=1 Tax=Pseudonocardia alaniniphila TaxID=75291 RepID=A0ABS9TG05_9PSEU|nr:hypothetical protein [Pseudonocardia alaniniphila]MCH6167457.1 hypothetical protein [Pseudonocardia alaniniphila]